MNKPLKIKWYFTIPIIILFLFWHNPSPANASPLSSAGKFSSCTAGGIAGGLAGPLISTKINAGLNNLKEHFPKLKGLLSVATANSSVPTTDIELNPKYQSKEYIQDIIARCAAREIMSKMGADITNIARTSGRNGGPAYIRNWRNFQTESQYRGERIFSAVLSNTKLCDYFSSGIKGLFGATTATAVPKNTRTGNLDPYALRANCTMPAGFNLTNYQNDFSGNGGWNAFSRMLEPQNNYYGALFGALDESAKQRALTETADINQVIANKGFLGRSGDNANDSCLQRDDAGKCLEYKDIKTPGTVISDAIGATFQQELAWVTNVDELSELVATAVEVLVNRLKDFSNPNEGDYIIPGEVEYDLNTLPAPGEGGGRCAGTNSGPIYESELNSAIDAVIVANPEGIADELNTDHNGFVFLSFLGPELERRGFNATATVLNGHDIPNHGDLIALQRPFEPLWERYDVIADSGLGNAPLKDVVGAEGGYVGSIPLSCVTGGGGGGGGGEETQPPEQAF